MICELDPEIHQPVRTRIIALLIREGEADFGTVKKELNLTDGHMTTHMRVLIDGGLVEVHKEFLNNKPKTTYRISKIGKKKFLTYLDDLKKILES